MFTSQLVKARQSGQHRNQFRRIVVDVGAELEGAIEYLAHLGCDIAVRHRQASAELGEQTELGLSPIDTVRFILQELERIGAVYRKNNTVSLMVDCYAPTHGSAELYEVFGDSAADLLETLEHNLSCEPSARRLQLSVVHNNLPDEVLDDVEVVCQDRGMVFLKSLNEFMTTQDRHSNPNLKGSGRNRAGVGVYFFKHPVEDPDRRA